MSIPNLGIRIRKHDYEQLQRIAKIRLDVQRYALRTKAYEYLAIRCKNPIYNSKGDKQKICLEPREVGSIFQFGKGH